MSLTNIEKHAIQNMVVEKIAIKDIAKELEKDESEVVDYLKGLLEDIEHTKAQEEYIPEIKRDIPKEEKKVVSAVPEGLVKKLMQNKTAGKGDKVVSIMTEGASAVSDDAKKSMQATKSRTAKGAIYNIEKQEIE